MCGSGEGIKGGQMSQELRSGLYISTAKRSSMLTRLPMNLTPPTTMKLGWLWLWLWLE